MKNQTLYARDNYVITTKRLVTLMSLLQVCAEKWIAATTGIDIILQCLERGEDVINSPQHTMHRNFLKQTLESLSELCEECDLPVTNLPVAAVLLAMNTNPQDLRPKVLEEFLKQIKYRLGDELSTKFIFQLPFAAKELYEHPTRKWERVIERFPEATTDIEELGRCLALQRYAAAVFHSVQAIEHGLIRLGAFLDVNDPLSGWTAVASELKKITNKKYPERSPRERKHFAFIEQMQGAVEALKNAWRNKISHAHGQKLVLVSSEFSPDTAEEIVSASRAFMRRLAEELPEASE